MVHSRKRRFTKSTPCPVCGGYDEAARGQGVRCFGFAQGAQAHCTREERAGAATFNPHTHTYSHRVEGPCPCATEHAPAPKSSSQQHKGKITATYDYTDEHGNLLSQAVRWSPKGFSQRRRDGKGGWVSSVKGVRRLPYRLPELLAAPPHAPVFIPEGEKDADRLVGLGLAASCNPEGAGKWRSEYSQHFEGRRVVILPDNDDQGRGHALQVAQHLQLFAESVKVLELPGLSDKGDVSDWLAAGGTREELVRLALAAPGYEFTGSISENGASPNLEGPRHKDITTPKLAAAIESDYRFAVDAGGKLYAYEDGVYRSGGERLVQGQVKALMLAWEAEDSWSSHKAEEAIKYIAADAPMLWEIPPADVLNLGNGLLDISDLGSPRLLPHSPDHLSPVQLPASYDPDADCPKVRAFRDDIWPEDALDTFFELFGVSAVAGLGKSKAILWIGSGGTGKSTGLRLLKEFIGRRLCSAMSLQRIEDNRFAVSGAIGKLLDICPDLPARHLDSSATFNPESTDAERPWGWNKG